MPAEAFSLRQATGQDSLAIRSLVIRSGINPTGLDWQRFIVATSQEGEIIGCGQIKPHRDGSLELASIAVKPERRGQGIARAIIEHLLTENPGELYLMCRSGLGGLYEKFGFRVIQEDQMPRYFRKVNRLAGIIDLLSRDGESLLVMKRDGE